MGDLSVFREAQLTYADADDFPKNLMEAQNIVVKAKAEFDGMPKEIREMFDIKPGDSIIALCDKDRGIALLKADVIDTLTDKVLR